MSDSILLILGCGVIAAGMTVVIVAALALSRRKERNARAHRLGRLLMCSHPEWN